MRNIGVFSESISPVYKINMKVLLRDRGVSCLWHVLSEGMGWGGGGEYPVVILVEGLGVGIPPS